MASDSFQDLMASLEAGDQLAAADLWRRFAPHLNALAQKRLNRKLQSEAEDAVQSAFKSFFKGLDFGRYELADWDSLGGFLARITLRKCMRRIEYYASAKRDATREVAQPRDDSAAEVFQAVDNELAPHVEVALQETLEAVVNDLTEQQLEIFVLDLQRLPVEEISAHVGRTERTVQRVLQQIRKRLEDAWNEE